MTGALDMHNPVKVSPTPEAVRNQLSRMLRSRRFNGSQRARQFLTYVTEETLAGRGDRIKAYNVATEAFGLDPGFDPQSSNVVRVAAHRLRQLLENYYADEGRQDDVCISLVAGKYKPTITKFVRRPQANIPVRGMDNASGRQPVFAVLPFQKVSPGVQSEWSSEALRQELLVAISRIPGVVVQHNNDADLLETADLILSGSVQHSSNATRIYVHLIGSRGGTSIWSDCFNAETAVHGDFEQQRIAAEAICSALRQALGAARPTGASRQHTYPVDKLVTFECTLQASFYYMDIGVETFNRALTACKTAVESAPDCAEAWAHLSNFLVEAYTTGFGEWWDEHRLLGQARNCAERAMQLNPECDLSLNAFCHLNFALRRPDEAIEFGERVIALSPGNANLRAHYGNVRAFSGDWDAGIRLVGEAAEVDPFHPAWFRYPTMHNAMRLGKPDKFLKLASKIGLDDFHVHRLNLAINYNRIGEKERARNILADFRRRWPDFDVEGAQVICRRFYPDDLFEMTKEGWRELGIAA